MALNAKSLILDLLSASAGEPLPVRDLVRACALFDIRETSARVAITRLGAAGLLESAGRGEYRLGEPAEALAREVSSWRNVERKVRAWDGAWVAAHVATASRGNGAAAKRRARALSMNGMRELERGLAIRPDNLEGGVDGVRTRLAALGLEAPVFRASSFDEETERRARRLWNEHALTASYRRGREKLERWMQNVDALEPEVAAREAFLYGTAAIKQIVLDPLLPSPLVDPDERRAFVDAMRRFDRVGRAIWWRLFRVRLGAQAPAIAEEARVH